METCCSCNNCAEPGSLPLNYNVPTKNAEIVTSKNIVKDIAPASDKAILTLSDGRKIILDNSSNGQLANRMVH